MAEDFEIDFDHEVIMRAEGAFEETSKIMKEEDFSKNSWMIATQCKIKSLYGEAEMELHFYHNGDVFIDSFRPSTEIDAYYNPDIRYLTAWLQDKGWHIPEPLPDLVRTNLDFWKHFWSSSLVNSGYLDELYGKRDAE